MRSSPQSVTAEPLKVAGDPHYQHSCRQHRFEAGEAAPERSGRDTSLPDQRREGLVGQREVVDGGAWRDAGGAGVLDDFTGDDSLDGQLASIVGC
jgi:hypothetical protein